MITSTCSYLNPGTAQWIVGQTRSATLAARVHAEVAAYQVTVANIANGLAVTHFSFNQNDFPCAECCTFFANESLKGLHFEFSCTANTGGYACECGYLPPRDARAFSRELAGTLIIINGESRGLYGAKIFSHAALLKATAAAEKADALLIGRRK